MKFSIQKEALLKPIQLVSGAVERRHNLPILANILFQVQGNQLTLTGTDLEVELVSTTVLTEHAEPGSITVPAKKCLDIVRSLPDSADVQIYVDGSKLIIKCGRSRFSLATLPASDYPNVDDWQPEIEFSTSAGKLKSLIDATQFSMAHQDVRYYLNGLLLETQGDTIKAVATDGHRLALSSQSIGQELPTNQVIIPRKGVVELLRLFDNDEQIIKVSIGQNSIRAVTEMASLTSKLVDGRFPDYRRVLPVGGTKIVTADRHWLRQCLLRASILSNEKFRGVRLNITPGAMNITANNPEQEEAEEVIDIEYQDDAIEVGFNVSYLLDVLNCLDCENVKLTFIDGNSSALIEDAANQDSTYVVMPMRL